ncbi:MAG: TldD/PmbA family protein [Candidatus Omnitrophica bacterium]|nr:TldD/PmbA family protein [Candidatus Omnitrophota bacterium]
MLLGEARLLDALRKAAKASAADQTLIAAQRGGQTTLRFSGGRIHQNFHEEDVTVWVKVAAGGRAGVSTTSSLRHDALMKAVESALHIARLSGKGTVPAFTTMPPQEPTPQVETYFPATIQRPLTQTVRMIRQLSAQAKKAGCDLAGSTTIGESELAVAGSGGLAQYQPSTVGGLRLVATRGASSGFAAQAFRDVRALEPERLVRQAVDHCRRNRDPESIPLGAYDVLLEPEAVAEIVEWLSCIGFGAKQVMERTSFLAGRVGEKLFSPKLSIWDDGSDPRGLAVPFDMEGAPKRRLDLVREGVAEGIAYDSHYGKLYHHPSTGHAPAYDELEGPLALNLFVAPGRETREDLLRRMDRGLWITRFHYVSGLLNTQQALMTGLTRDGTFLVKKGKPAGAVKNLRFTQSILEAFSKKLAGVGRDLQLVADPAQGVSAVVTPALLIRGFTFTGQTR